MLTNTTFKKISTAMMLLAMCSMMFMTIGCSDTEDGPVAPNTNDDIVTFAGPDGEEIQISQAEIDKFATQSQTYENMIEAMDPYVTENTDGTYKFDSESYMAKYPKLEVDVQATYDELTKGIPIVNQEILAEKRTGVSSALGSACWYYWWGKRCCYWGDTGWKIVSLLNAGAFLPPPFNYVVGGLGIYLAYYMSVYGGFCLNQSWVGGQWVTRP